MMELIYRRPDGTFVAIVNGYPYHVTHDDKHYAEALEVAATMGDALTFEPVPPEQLPTSVSVNAERDRRITSGFLFRGKIFDFDDKSKQRVAGAATLAGFAIGAGAPVGYLRWHGGDKDFTWITQDNTLMPMDAQTCFLFGQTAAEHESNFIFKAKDIKNMNPIPSDYTDDRYWV